MASVEARHLNLLNQQRYLCISHDLIFSVWVDLFLVMLLNMGLLTKLQEFEWICLQYPDGFRADSNAGELFA